MKTLAIIPAQGGSKSIPRRNVLPIVDKQVIARSIQEVLPTLYVDQIAVSTDEAEIGEAAQWYAAGVAWWPEEISGAHLNPGFNLLGESQESRL